MKRSIVIFILFVDFAASLKVISSFIDFERASSAKIKGKLHSTNNPEVIEDLSLCFRFLAFFKQKTTLGVYKYKTIRMDHGEGGPFVKNPDKILKN